MVDNTQQSSTRVEETFRAIRDEVVNGDLEPGSRLAVEPLRARYEVGSSTIREALTLLVADALATSEGQRGFRVAEVSAQDLADLSRTRVLIEGRALAESIELGDDEWEAGLVAAHHQMTKAQDRLDAGDADAPGAWEIKNQEFHSALVAACESRWLRHMLDMLHHHSERYRRITMRLDQRVRDVRSEHDELMDATLDRDADRACKILEEHILNTADAIAALSSDTEHR